MHGRDVRLFDCNLGFIQESMISPKSCLGETNPSDSIIFRAVKCKLFGISSIILEKLLDLEEKCLRGQSLVMENYLLTRRHCK